MRRRTGEGAIYDFRVQTQPALQGEHLIIRLLSQSAPLLSLADLGFAPEVMASLERLLASAGGLVVISGPTGSGKTTTLYALLDRLRRAGDLKIVTAEDPVEYALARVQQSQVHAEIGYTFASATRAFLREDPDVILVGETRDLETGLETVRASQTGHLVLTTLHANDAVNSIRRLIDLGLDTASVASELLAVLAQRLVRRVCEGCRVEYAPPPALVAELWPAGPPAGLVFTRGAGCERCRSSGFRGRLVIAELWETGDAVRDAILRDASPGALRDLARRLGFRTIVDDARAKIAAGATTVEETIAALPYSVIAHRAPAG
jgi:type IV pilus assembly protein PilB